MLCSVQGEMRKIKRIKYQLDSGGVSDRERARVNVWEMKHIAGLKPTINVFVEK